MRKIRNETAILPGFSTEKQPTFRSQYESFFTEILNNNYGCEVQDGVQNDTGNGSVNGSVKNGLTTQEIMSKLKLSERTAYRELATLKRLGLIQRIGSDKTGHWEVTCPPNVPQDVSQDGSVNVAQEDGVFQKTHI